VARSRWKQDLLLVLACFVALLVISERPVPRVRALIAAPAKFTAGGVSLAGHALVPLGLPDAAAALAAALLALTAIRAGRWTAHRATRQADEAPHWLLVAGTAAIFAWASHVMFFGTSLYPTSDGTDNRGNVLAAYGYVVLAYALLQSIVGAVLKPPRLGRPVRVAAVSAAVGLVLATGYLVQLRRDIGRWDEANRLQEQSLARLSDAVKGGVAGRTLYVFGAPSRVSPGIPVFWDTGDLDGAVRIMFDEPTVTAIPIYGRTRVICGRRELFPSLPGYPNGPDGGYGEDQAARYGAARFVDLRTGTVKTIHDRRGCVAAKKQFVPGPIFASSEHGPA
jgi:hypothetical protein